MASYPASLQIPWLGDQYAAAQTAWEQNPTDTVRCLEMGMIAVIMCTLKTQQKCWISDTEMPWPSPTDLDPTPSPGRL